MIVRHVLVAAVVLGLVAQAFAAGAVFGVFDGARAVRARAMPAAEFALATGVQPAETLSDELAGAYGLFVQPTSNAVLQFTGLSNDDAAAFGLVKAAELSGDAIELSSVKAVESPNVKELVATLNDASIATSFDLAARTFTVNSVSMSLGEQSVRALIKDLHALSSLSVKGTPRTALVLDGVGAIASKFGRTSSEFAAARSAAARLVQRFVAAAPARTLTTVLLGGDARASSTMAAPAVLSAKPAAAVAAAAAVQSLPAAVRRVGVQKTVTPSLEIEFGQYQIGIWVFFILTIVIIAFVAGTCDMTFAKDMFTRELFREERGPI